MPRAPIGQRIRKRRQELALTQLELARQVGISASYLNLIEHNKRSIGGALLHRIAAAIAIDSRALAGTEEARLIAELGEMESEAGRLGISLRPEDARDLVATNPQAARTILGLYRAYREARAHSDLVGQRLGEDSFLAEASQRILALITTIRSYAEILEDYGDLTEEERRRFVATLVSDSERLANRATDLFDFMGGRGRGRPRSSPREEIEDFVSDRANFFPRIEDAAQESRAAFGEETGPGLERLIGDLRSRHGIAVRRVPAGELPAAGEQRREGEFLIAEELTRGSQRFRLARLLGKIEHGALLGELVEGAGLSSPDARPQLEKALASYFAAALLMPYAEFLRAANRTRYDVLALCRQFDVSFEQACHRLTTLRRPGEEGVPLHFLRTDIAGNISKRFSASGLRLPRYGSACPRWIIHHAFTAPGRIVTQVAELADGDRYLSIARAEVPPGVASGHPIHAVMIGAAIGHARRFAYADGLDLADPGLPTPVGVTCRQCPREDCGERAYERAPLMARPAARPR